MKISPKDYYKVSVATDVVVFTVEDNQLKVLTIRRADEPFKNHRALPGGFVLPGHDSITTAKRVLKEKAGLENVYFEQLYTFDNPKRDPRGPIISVSYFALVPRKAVSPQISEQTQEPTFVDIKNLGRLAFDHADIIAYAHERLRGKLEYSNIAFSLLPQFFTFTELQNLYETIFGKTLDKRNFRKKIVRLGLIKATNKKVKNGRQRPAMLYTSATTKTKTFKKPF
jgi:8-oxo-dGTP diphosphatase